MKHCFVYMFILFCVGTSCAQVTLERCKELARDNYPVIKRYGLVERGRRLTVENAAKAWLPQAGVSGTASYQSDVTTIPVDIPGVDIPALSKDQYDVSITVSQQLYDGGAVSSAKRLAEAQGDVGREQVSVAMYDVNRRIDELFFGILVLDEQLKQVGVLQSDLSLSLASVEAMVKGGTANQTDVDAVKVEQVKAHQMETSLLTQRNTYLKMLSTFIGKEIGDGDTLLDARLKSLNVALRPNVGLFVRGGYGNPGLNMLKDDFDAYYKVGVTLSWNFGSLYTRANDRRKIEAERLTVQSERDAFLFDTRLQTELKSGAVGSLRKQIEQDDEIIKLRKRIREKAELRVANGTETVNEMLRDINAVSDAQLAKRLHEIQLLQEMYKIKHLNNF